jgi:peptidoglycan/xylan/chitin deacetylase (PgdA/CDA1 family)
VDPSGSPLSLAPEAFARQLDALQRAGLDVLGLPELLASPDGRRAVALTFDDGFGNLAEQAWPRLAERGWPATVFVVSRHVGGTNAWARRDGGGVPELPLLGWDALAALAEQGLGLGVHGARHRDLRRLPAAELEDELAGARAAIEDRLGRPAPELAYPYGRWDRASVAAARRHFERALTTAAAPLREGDDPHRLPRLDALDFRRDPEALAGWGDPPFARRLSRLARRAAARDLWHGLRRRLAAR